MSAPVYAAQVRRGVVISSENLARFIEEQAAALAASEAREATLLSENDRLHALHLDRTKRTAKDLKDLLAREATLREALVRAVVPLEVLAAQIAVRAFSELTDLLQDEIRGATIAVRAALSGEGPEAGTREKVLRFVVSERERQEAAVEKHHGEGWRSPASADCSDETRLAILIEEVGEVANALNERRVGKPFDLLAELVQVAAVAAAWAESLAGEGPEAE